jgi:hypothetical protein
MDTTVKRAVRAVYGDRDSSVVDYGQGGDQDLGVDRDKMVNFTSSFYDALNLLDKAVDDLEGLSGDLDALDLSDARDEIDNIAGELRAIEGTADRLLSRVNDVISEVTGE